MTGSERSAPSRRPDARGGVAQNLVSGLGRDRDALDWRDADQRPKNSLFSCKSCLFLGIDFPVPCNRLPCSSGRNDGRAPAPADVGWRSGASAPPVLGSVRDRTPGERHLLTCQRVCFIFVLHEKPSNDLDQYAPTPSHAANPIWRPPRAPLAGGDRGRHACAWAPACSTLMAVSTLSPPAPWALRTKQPSRASKPTTTRT